jgi:hypothetical protein
MRGIIFQKNKKGERKKKNKKDLKKKILFPISHNREPLGVQPT